MGYVIDALADKCSTVIRKNTPPSLPLMFESPFWKKGVKDLDEVDRAIMQTMWGEDKRLQFDVWSLLLLLHM